MSAIDSLKAGICPNCKTMEIDIRPDFISCRCCGIRGDPHNMKWCDRVPIFRSVKKEDLWLVEGQLYKKDEQLFVVAGYAPGCDRVIEGEFCRSCMRFMPEAIDRPSRKAKKKSGKDLAAGEEEEVAV